MSITAIPAAQQAVIDPTLMTILSWPRAHGTQNELDFRKWLVTKLVDLGCSVKHKQVNLTVTVGLSPTTLFSCHMDTVGDAGVEAGLRKTLCYDPAMQIISLDRDSVGGSLGADDGVGVWLMLEMIKAGVTGEYIFHVGEEVGCIGSRAMALKEKTYLKQFDAAVAFDRPDNTEVIISQGGLRCASDKYGNALAKQLGHNYEISHRGVLTDTKIYRGIIPECVNIGVGYNSQHGRGEYQDYDHLLKLREAVLKVQWDSLPVDRDPTAPDPRPAWQGDMWSSGRSLGDWGPREVGYGYDGLKKPAAKKSKKKQPPPVFEPLDSAYDELKGNHRDDLMVFAEDDPEAMVDTMIRLMREVSQLRADIAYMETLI